MPYRGDTPASTTSRTIFAVEKIWFSTGTRTARPRPVRTLSCRLKTHHAIVAATNHARNAGCWRNPSRGAHSRAPATKTTAVSAPSASEIP